MKRKLARFLALEARERGVLLQAALLLPVAWLGLRGLGLQRMLRLASGGSGTAAGPGLAPARLGELVAIAATQIPFHSTCLTRSLLLVWMLGRRGVRGELRIGVRKAAEGIESHAWVECAGVPVNDGDGESTRYAVLAVPPAREPPSLR